MTLADDIAAAVAAAGWPTASAAKRGRNPRWPYVPVLNYGDLRPMSPTHQIRGRAFATRPEAVADAQDYIDRARAKLADELARPNYRALREYHGLPRELPATEQETHQPMTTTDLRTDVALTEAEASAAVAGLCALLTAPDAGDCSTWHGGNGFDDCPACRALVTIRPAAGIAAADHLRP